MYAEQPDGTVKIADIVKYTNFTAKDIIDVLEEKRWLLWSGNDCEIYLKKNDIEKIIEKRKKR